jgi:hypothetical protein
MGLRELRKIQPIAKPSDLGPGLRRDERNEFNRRHASGYALAALPRLKSHG